MKKTLLGGSVLFLVLAATHAEAQSKVDGKPHVMGGSASFLSTHNDLRFRRDGLASLEDGLPEAAIAQFQHAARHADKPSQAMLAELYWKGEVVPVDRPRAYAWMDLAAERGYRQFLALREHYWAGLSEAERQQAIEVGRALYAEYGDPVAIPRMERQLRDARRDITGSRVGFVSGPMKVIIRGENGGFAHENGEKIHARQYWDPALYQQWKDESYRRHLEGQVDVGELQPVVRETEGDDGTANL